MLAHQLKRRQAGPTLPYSAPKTYASISGLSSYTFSACVLGANGTSRDVFVAICGSSSAAISSVTVDGVSASEVYTAGTAPRRALWKATGVTAATGNVVVTFASAQSRCGIHVFSTYGMGSTVSGAIGTAAISINTVNPSLLVGIYHGAVDGSTYRHYVGIEYYTSVITATVDSTPAGVWDVSVNALTDGVVTAEAYEGAEFKYLMGIVLS
jgi:hypothetical protein